MKALFPSIRKCQGGEVGVGVRGSILIEAGGGGLGGPGKKITFEM